MTIPVYILTSDKYLPLLRGFSYLFNIYWSSLQPVIVGGYREPPPLPFNFTFCQLGSRDPGPDKWSDGLIRLLQVQQHKYFVFMLEDYYLVRGVDHNAIITLTEYLDITNGFRCDLTADVLHAYGDARNAHEVAYYGHYDIIEKSPGVEYRTSFQASIWNREMLLEILRPGMSSWNVEMFLKVPDNWKVLGTRQIPVRYANIMYQGKMKEEEVEKIPEEHREKVREWLK